MRAVVIDQFGPAEVLRSVDVAPPEIGPEDVMIQVHAVSVNRSFDLMVRAGSYKRAGIRLPLILGADPAGIVTAVGEAVRDFASGDRVSVTSSISCGECAHCRAGNRAGCSNHSTIGVQRNGGYAEYVAVPATNVHLIPDTIGFAEAGFVTRHGGTAFRQLQCAELRPGEWTLVMGAAGSLGSCGVQAAKYLGGRVIAAAGSDSRVRAAMELGADFGINYRAQDLAAEVTKITGGHGVDVVMENISDPATWPKALESLAHGGRMVTGGAHGGGRVELDVNVLYKRRLRIIGCVGASRTDVDTALKAAGENRLRSLIDRVLPLERAVEAHRLVESGHVVGKVVLDPTIVDGRT